MRTLFLLCALALWASPGLAQSSAADRAAAEVLFEQAIRLLEANKAKEACPKLEESQRLDPGVGTLLYLADCYKIIGRTASAWATFKEASYAAAAAGQSERQQIANTEADKIKPLLSFVTLQVAANDTPELTIKRDGQPVRKALWGTPIPVDPGSHSIQAEATGRKSWEKTIDVPNQSGNVVVSVPALDEAEAEPVDVPVAATAAPQPVASSVGADEKPVTDTKSGGSSMATLGWVAVGVGGAGIVMGSLFGYMASQDSNAADDDCRRDDATLCNSEGVDRADSARSRAMVANIGFGVGLAAVTTGVVLLLTAPDESNGAAPPVTVQAALGPGAGGFVVRGGF